MGSENTGVKGIIRKVRAQIATAEPGQIDKLAEEIAKEECLESAPHATPSPRKTSAHRPKTSVNQVNGRP
jgi:hypothetical protein